VEAVGAASRSTRREVVGEALAWRQSTRRRGRCRGGASAAHLKRRIVVMGGVDYINVPVATDE
jgi:hypothetical protein